MKKSFQTKITEMLGIEHPILCGGMQSITTADFVSKICNAGGLGFITAETFETPERLREELRKMPSLTNKPFGVNISLIPEFEVGERTLRFVDVICEEGVKVVETAGRSPEFLLAKTKEAGIKVIHKCTSVRHAETAQRIGVDAVSLLGYGSGGHIGLENVASFVSIPLAVSSLHIPVIAAGGICNGRGFLGALAMGAEGILMGTAFFATKECPVHPAIKERLVQTKANETGLIMGSIRNPMRVALNRMATEVMSMEAEGTTLEAILEKVAGGKQKISYETGDAESSPIVCGQGVGLINEIKSVKEVIDGIITEARELLDRLNHLLQ
jgi:NAD(P)H-dependent flavin oxidoreductase YrpB (nitropropane dioxygenase family)